MEMAAQISSNITTTTTTSKLYLKPFVLFMCQLVLIHIQALPINNTCESSTSPEDIASGFHCNSSTTNHCDTFAILRANSHFSSLTNLSLYLGINRFAISEANGFSAETEILSRDQPLLIPIHCECESSGVFQSQLLKTSLKGESLSEIFDSLEGLTTCKAIKNKNPNVSPWTNLGDKVSLVIPLPCACPSSEFTQKPSNLFLTYPVSEGDTISNLAIKLNTTKEAIISANKNRSSKAFFSPEESLKPFSSLLVPVSTRPIFDNLAKPREPSFRLPGSKIPVISPHKKKPKMTGIGLYIALTGIFVGVSIAVAVAFLLIQLKKKQGVVSKGGNDLELQQLSLSVRTTSDKKVSFDGSNQDALDGSVITTATPRKPILDTYTAEELSKATEDFSSGNHIEGSVYHGRLSGKNLAIKRVKQEIFSKLDFGLFNDAIHRHPNIMRLVGTCLNEETSSHGSFLVFEYAKNGSLKDWLHGGLAIKNQFIASCYCFLTWSQRLRICLDVAMALQYMHHIMDPCYVHRQIKSRNIFLDEEFNAKIGNFGLAKCAEDDTDSTDTLSLSSSSSSSWSVGYLAPEYLSQGVISPSIDIFAFGLVLLEVLSGQTPVLRPNEKGGSDMRLSEMIKLVLESENVEENVREWMDKALGENYSLDAAIALANMGRACTEDNPAMRPTAEEIVEKLVRLVEESPLQGESSLVSESSSKPLVKAVANSNNE